MHDPLTIQGLFSFILSCPDITSQKRDMAKQQGTGGEAQQQGGHSRHEAHSTSDVPERCAAGVALMVLRCWCCAAGVALVVVVRCWCC